MACLSSEYLVNDNEIDINEIEKFGSCRFNALIHSVKSDLLPLLMAAKKEINKLPVMYLKEANT